MITNHSSENWSLLAPGHKLLMMSHCKTTKGYSKTTISLTLKEKSIQSEIFKSLMMNSDSKIWLLSRNQWQKWKNVSTEKFGESIFGGFYEFFEKFLDKRNLILCLVYVRGNDKRLKAEFETLKKVKENLLEGKHIRFLEWEEKETEYN